MPPLRPGQRFKFTGFTGPEDGIVDGTKGTTYTVAAIVNNITVNFNYGDYSPINWQIQWMSDYKAAGDELISGNTGFVDQSLPPVDTMITEGDCTLVVGARPGVCLENATLTFSTNVQTFGNSCTKGWQQGIAGATSVTLSSSCHSDNFGVFAENHLPGANENVKIYVEGGNLAQGQTCAGAGRKCWEFEKMIIGSLSGLNVDIAGGGVVSFSVNMEFNAFPDGQRGYIKFNDDTFWTATPSMSTP